MRIFVKTLEDTEKLAQELALAEPRVIALAEPRVIALVGDLGSGKTTFAQFYARALGLSEPLNSPTFAIAREYPTIDLVHLDLYRIEEEEELELIGFSDYLNHRHVLIEWPQIASEMLPEETLWLSIEEVEGGRYFSWEEE